MSLIARLGRPMIAGVFVSQGFDQLRSPAGRAELVDQAITPEIDESLQASPLPDDRTDLVRINGAVQLGAGLMLATNRAPRLAALALAGSLVPTTYAGHRFWEEEDEDTRAAERTQFMKNLAMLGGLLVTTGDTGGRPSVPWRVKRGVEDLVDRSPGAADKLGSAASTAAGTASSVAGDAADVATDLAATAAEVVPVKARAARSSLGEALAIAAGAISSAAATMRTVAKQDIAPKLVDVRDQAVPILRDVTDAIPTPSAS